MGVSGTVLNRERGVGGLGGGEGGDCIEHDLVHNVADIMISNATLLGCVCVCRTEIASNCVCVRVCACLRARACSYRSRTHQRTCKIAGDVSATHKYVCIPVWRSLIWPTTLPVRGAAFKVSLTVSLINSIWSSETILFADEYV